MDVTGKRSIFWTRRNLGLMMRTQNAFTRLKYTACSEKHIFDHTKIDLNQAERYLCKGLKVAREQKAKSLELRLCVSLYDLYELRQNGDKYRSQLGEIYRSFSEGFNTTDLVRAKARLKNA